MNIRFDSPRYPVASRADNADPVARQTSNAVEQPRIAQRTLGDMLKQSGEAAKAFGDSLTARFDEARKESARKEVEQIRETVKMLKRLMLLLGGSKEMAKQLQQMARSLAEASEVLNDEGGKSPSSGLAEGVLYSEAGMTTGQRPVVAEADMLAKTEANVAAADAERELGDLPTGDEEQAANADAQAQPSVGGLVVDVMVGAGRQQSGDADLLAKALRELKLLAVAAKAAQQKRDREDRKRFEEIEENLQLTEKNMLALGMASAPQVSLSIRI